MAIVMAIALWFFAISKHTGDIQEDIQLTINTPPGLTILETSSNYGNCWFEWHSNYY